MTQRNYDDYVVGAVFTEQLGDVQVTFIKERDFRTARCSEKPKSLIAIYTSMLKIKGDRRARLIVANYGYAIKHVLRKYTNQEPEITDDQQGRMQYQRGYEAGFEEARRRWEAIFNWDPRR